MKIKLTYCLFFIFSALLGQNSIVDSLEQAANRQNGKEKAKTLILLAKEYQNIDLKKSNELAFKALKIAELKKDNWLMAEAAISLTVGYYTSGELFEAEKYCKQSYELTKKTKDKNQLASVFNNFGLIYLELGNNVLAQDYLEKFLEAEKELGKPEGIAMAYGNLGLVWEIKGEIDSALYFYSLSLEMDKKADNKLGMAFSYNNLGIINEFKGNYDLAIENYLLSIKLFEECNHKTGLASVYNNIGIVYSGRGNYGKAMEVYQKSLKVEEELGNTIGTATALNNIGEIYSVWGDLDKAMEYYYLSLKIVEKGGNLNDIALKNLNIGAIYDKKQMEDSALVYYQKSLELYTKADNIEGQGSVYNNIASIYLHKEIYNEAFEYYNKALEIRKKLKEKRGYAVVLTNLAQIYIYWKNYDKAIKNLEESREILANAKIIKDLAANYKVSSRLLHEIGEDVEALSLIKKYGNIQDSIFNVENYRQFTSLREKYESDKIEEELKVKNSEHELNVAKSQLDAQKAKQLLFQVLMISIGVVVMLVFVILFFRLNKQKKKINASLIIQNEELRQQKEEMSSQRDEIEAQRDDLSRQHMLEVIQKDLISKQHEEITDSIKYTRNIQEALYPDIGLIKQYFSEVSVIRKPKEIISGDFSLFHEDEENIVFAIADATGHGVPSAFLSMLGIALINDLLISNSGNPAEILNKLREDFISAFSTEQQDAFENREGIDIALIVVSKNQKTISYAGAKRPVIIMNVDGSLDYLEPDKMPVGEHRLSKIPFACKTHKIEKGSTIFMFTDGFTDQIGGIEQTKYGKKRLMNLLEKIGNLPINELEVKLIEDHEEWKGKYKQVDDVLFVCLRV
ncbi:MAG: tetratricopeptide repeat protein [Bacteroidales bacterium]|nr:tetratricopeptide repeat protein [Bacteroidales bacterium]